MNWNETYSKWLHVIEGSFECGLVDLIDSRGSLQPRIIEGILGWYSFYGVFLEHATNEWLRSFRDSVPVLAIKGIFADLNLLHNLFIIVTVERWLSTEKNVENDATTPKVTLLVIFLREYFGRNVIGSSQFLVHFYVRIISDGCTEIDNFE